MYLHQLGTDVRRKQTCGLSLYHCPLICNARIINKFFQSFVFHLRLMLRLIEFKRKDLYPVRPWVLPEYFSVGSTLEEATWVIREGTSFGNNVNEVDISLLHSRKVISVPCPSFFIQAVMRMYPGFLQSSICLLFWRSLSPCPHYGLSHTKNSF